MEAKKPREFGSSSYQLAAYLAAVQYACAKTATIHPVAFGIASDGYVSIHILVIGL